MDLILILGATARQSRLIAERFGLPDSRWHHVVDESVVHGAAVSGTPLILASDDWRSRADAGEISTAIYHTNAELWHR